MFFSRSKATDERCDDLGEQLTLPLVGVADETGECHLLQIDKTAQRSKDMVEYRNPASHLKPLDVANLFDHAVVLQHQLRQLTQSTSSINA